VGVGEGGDAGGPGVKLMRRGRGVRACTPTQSLALVHAASARTRAAGQPAGLLADSGHPAAVVSAASGTHALWAHAPLHLPGWRAGARHHAPSDSRSP